MFLLTFNEWIGPSRDYCGNIPKVPTERMVAFATNLELSDALRRIKKYQDEYNTCFYPTTAIAFRLLGVSSIGEVNAEDLTGLDVEFVESLMIW